MNDPDSPEARRRAYWTFDHQSRPPYPGYAPYPPPMRPQPPKPNAWAAAGTVLAVVLAIVGLLAVAFFVVLIAAVSQIGHNK